MMVALFRSVSAISFKCSTNPSQNSLFKADTSVRAVAESGILGLVHMRKRGCRPSAVKGLRFAKSDLASLRSTP
jgi:hypothetical protein